MKKTVTFEKKITFPTMIGEITAIDLEHNLRFVDGSNVEGDFFVKGKYKLTEASRLEEDFNYKIPTEIALTEKLDLDTAKIDIVDFYYRIENEDVMVCNIELKIEGVEEIETEVVKEEVQEDRKREIEDANLVLEKIENQEREERECDGDMKKEEEKEIPHKEEEKKIEEEVQEIKLDAKDLNKEKERETEEVEEESWQKEKEEVEVIEEKDNNISSLFSSLSEKEETFASYSVYILREEETINTIIDKYKTTKEELEKYNDLSSLTVGTKIIIPTLVND